MVSMHACSHLCVFAVRCHSRLISIYNGYIVPLVRVADSLESAGHGSEDDLVPARPEGELVEGNCNDSSGDGPHPEDPLVVPVAGHQRCPKGARRVDAAHINNSNATAIHCCLCMLGN